MTSSAKGLRHLRLLIATTLLVGGCAGPAFVLEEPEEEPAVDVSGVYRGTLEIEGALYAAEVVLEQDGGRLTGSLASELGLNTPLRGYVGGTRVSLLFEYGEECEGDGRLIGEVAPSGNRVLGRIAAVDCTGRVEGGFTLVPLD